MILDQGNVTIPGKANVESALFSTDLLKTKHKVLWDEVLLENVGVPYVVLGCKMLDCQHGHDKNMARKRRQEEKKEKPNVRFD